MIIRIIFVFLVLVFPAATFALEIKSDAFERGGKIPPEYSCDAEDISPPLSWRGVPAGTKSLALVCSDPDAPFKPWTHWVIYNIPAEKQGLAQDAPKIAILGDGSIQGVNDFGKTGYAGPCPPGKSPHRYTFTLYCLDSSLTLSQNATKADLLKAIKGRVLAEAEITGLYGR